MVAANSINESTTGIVGFTGTAFVGTPVTQYNVITGAATSSTLNNVAPSATSGVPAISQGASSQPAFGTAVVAGGGTGNTTFTAYSVIAAGTTSTGAFQSIGTGTTGQVLTSQGASALPIWAAAGGTGSLVWIQTSTAVSDATLDFTTSTTTYNNYLFVWRNVVPETNGANFQLQVSVDGGSNWLATGYTSGQWDYTYNGTTIANTNSTSVVLTTGPISSTASNGPSSGHLWFHNINSSNKDSWEGQSFYFNSSGSTNKFSFFGGQVTTGVNAYRWKMSSGDIGTGTVTLYGISNS